MVAVAKLQAMEINRKQSFSLDLPHLRIRQKTIAGHVVRPITLDTIAQNSAKKKGKLNVIDVTIIRKIVATAKTKVIK